MFQPQREFSRQREFSARARFQVDRPTRTCASVSRTPQRKFFSLFDKTFNLDAARSRRIIFIYRLFSFSSLFLRLTTPRMYIVTYMYTHANCLSLYHLRALHFPSPTRPRRLSENDDTSHSRSSLVMSRGQRSSVPPQIPRGTPL